MEIIYLMAIIHAHDPALNRSVGFFPDARACEARKSLLETDEQTAHCVTFICSNPETKRRYDNPSRKSFGVPCSGVMLVRK